MTTAFIARRGRPAGVTVLSALAALGALLSLAAGVAIAAAGVFEAGLGVSSNDVAVAEVAAAYLLLIGLLQLVFAWGWWALRRWAWALGALAQAIGLLATISAAATRFIEAGHATLAILVHGALLGYLLSPSVRRAFPWHEPSNPTHSSGRPW
jgi:hypothetical protein